jgi:hypothetical protein
VPVGLVIASVLGMAAFVLHQNAMVDVDLSALRGEFLGLAFLVTLGATAAAGSAWRFLLVSDNARVQLPEVLRIWWLATPSKYGIGAIGHYAGRLYLAEKAGIPRSIVVRSFAQEAVLIVGSGVAVVFGLAPTEIERVSSVDPQLVAFGPFLSVGIIATLPAALAVIGSTSRRSWRDWPGVCGSLYPSVAAAGLVVLNWCLLGGTAFVLLNSFRPTNPALYPACIASVTLGILSGMIGVTPVGLGVRELVLTLALSQFAPVAEATAVVILHRLCTFVVDLSCAGGALVLWRQSPAFRDDRQ